MPKYIIGTTLTQRETELLSQLLLLGLPCLPSDGSRRRGRGLAERIIASLGPVVPVPEPAVLPDDAPAPNSPIEAIELAFEALLSWLRAARSAPADLTVTPIVSTADGLQEAMPGAEWAPDDLVGFAGQYQGLHAALERAVERPWWFRQLLPGRHSIGHHIGHVANWTTRCAHRHRSGKRRYHWLRTQS